MKSEDLSGEDLSGTPLYSPLPNCYGWYDQGPDDLDRDYQKLIRSFRDQPIKKLITIFSFDFLGDLDIYDFSDHDPIIIFENQEIIRILVTIFTELCCYDCVYPQISLSSQFVKYRGGYKEP